MKFDVVLACGGSGSRCNLGYNKLLLDIGGISLIEKTISCFTHKDIAKIIIAYNPNDLTYIQSLKNNHQNIILCEGGNTRTQSIANALEFSDSEYVLIHDGARPFLPMDCLEKCMADVVQYGTSVLYTNSTDSLRQIKDGKSYPIDRNTIVKIQTPQAFITKEIKKAYSIADNNVTYTDDASLYQALTGKDIHLTLGSEKNIKITTPTDCNNLYANDIFVGNGWDTHRLGENRKLILGGIEIPHTKGLIAHSDGDVLIHAIMDAILTAMHERDIGVLFPDSDDKYKDISSLILLEEVMKIVKAKGLKIKSITAVIMAQKPKLSPFIPAIQSSLAKAMDTCVDNVSLSATTTEKLGLVGREEGISVSSVAVLTKA